MSALNKAVKADPIYTPAGARAVPIKANQQLRRVVLACMLWEDQFYVEGKTLADQIRSACADVETKVIADLAVEARLLHNLRHVPLLLLCELIRKCSKTALVSKTIAAVVSRPDEMKELLVMYMAEQDLGPRDMAKYPRQLIKGLGQAFLKFDEYQFAKYNKQGKEAVTLLDVMRLTHPKPKDETQNELFKRIKTGTLKTPDTWETRLSSGEAPKAVFEDLLKRGKLGYMAILRNLRNMEKAGVDETLIEQQLVRGAGRGKVFPFRFLAAAQAAPNFEEILERAMFAHLAQAPKLSGSTIFIVDISGSMFGGSMSARSKMSREHAACALAMIARERCEKAFIYATAGSDGARKHATAQVPARRGFALPDAILKMRDQIGGGGIFLNQCMRWIKERHDSATRVIVITDEADCSYGAADSPEKAPLLGTYNYMINVATYQNGIGYRKWTHIDGFSEATLDWIIETE